LLYKFLPIDTEFYNKIQLTKTRKLNPLFNYGKNGTVFLLAGCISVISIYKIVNFKYIQLTLPIFLSFIGVAINYLANNRKIAPLNSETKLINYLLLPVRNIVIMYLGLSLSILIYTFLPFSSMIILISIIVYRAIMDLIIQKYRSPEFDKGVLSMCGIKVRKMENKI